MSENVGLFRLPCKDMDCSEFIEVFSEWDYKWRPVRKDRLVSLSDVLTDGDIFQRSPKIEILLECLTAKDYTAWEGAFRDAVRACLARAEEKVKEVRE